jgi:ankyrin repeat protein
VPKPTDHLDLVNIASPCHADWDSMIGNDRVRFCSHCNLNVHNFSEMTPKEAMRLIIKLRGRLCVRYYRRPESNVQHITPRLYQIGRRASRLAAGTFSALLSLSSAAAAAQAASPSRALLEGGVEIAALNEITRPELSQTPGSTIVGRILDPQGAAVFGTRLTLTNDQTGMERTAVSNDEGVYQFQFLEAGVYTLRAEQAGFQSSVITGIILDGTNEQIINSTLEVGALMGDVAIAEPSDPLVKAAMSDDLDAVKQLLYAGANVNAVDETYHTTALALAVSHGNLEMVQALLWAGADANAKNNKGQTPLMSLSGRSTAEVVQALIKAGAKIDLQDEDGDTALMLAATDDNAEVLQALLDAGASINMKNERRQTALMLAAREGLTDNVKALIAAGADVNEQDEDGWTALTYARDNDHPDVMKVLKTYAAIEYSAQ